MTRSATRCSTLAALAALAGAACGGTQPARIGRGAEPEQDEPPPTYAVSLRFEDAGTAPDTSPRTRAVLVRIAPGGERTTVELSEEIGACYHEEAPADVLVAARCWWAGEGARYVVTRQGDAVVASRAEVHEETGAGPLEEVGRVEVPPEARLQVLGPTPSS